MKKQMIMGLMVAVMGMILVAGCNKAPEYGYTSDGRPAKPLKMGTAPKIEPGKERNMLDYYRGKVK